jgi:hypothetical protein
MSALAVSNDVLRASLRPPATPSLSTWLELRAADWFPTFERGQSRALDWLEERAPWQRYVVGAALGALIGLGALLGVAGVLRWQRVDMAAALIPHGAERTSARAAVPAASAAALPEPTTAGQSVPEQVIENRAPEPQPALRAVTHRQKRSHSQPRMAPARRVR